MAIQEELTFADYDREIGFDLETVNLEKLRGRNERGTTLHGAGDYR